MPRRSGPVRGCSLTIDGRAVSHDEVLAELQVLSRAGARETTAVEVGEGLERANLFAVAEQLAARAATPSTRRQYAAIYRSFGDWLREQLGRPPAVADLDVDAIAAYARFPESAGGRGGGPAAPATRRIYLSMVRALARQLGRHDVAAGVKVPRHKAGPPETLTEIDYENLLRVPDRRLVRGKRDYALLRVLGDCGLRSAGCAASSRATCAARAPTPGTCGCSCAARAAPNARCRSPRRPRPRCRPG